MVNYRELVDEILNKQVIEGQVKYLVKWKAHLRRKPSWVAADQLSSSIPLMLWHFEQRHERSHKVVPSRPRPRPLVPKGKLFNQVPVTKPILGKDAVAKILGCRHSGRTVLYAVQFRQRPDGVCVGAGVYSQDELLRHEPAILGQFIAHKAVLRTE